MADPNDVEAAPGGVQTRNSQPDINHEAVQEKTLPPRQINENIEADATRAVEVEKVVVLSFRGLQLRRIVEVQDELLKLALNSALNEPSAGSTIDLALSAYAQALRDYETLSLNALPRIPVGARLVGAMDTDRAEPQIATYAEVLAYIMGGSGLDDAMELWEKLYPKSPAARRYHSENDGLAPSEVVNLLEAIGGDLGFRELDKNGREQRSKKQAFIQRIIMAMFGGLALIGPMLIMTLHPSRNTSLITVSHSHISFRASFSVHCKG